MKKISFILPIIFLSRVIFSQQSDTSRLSLIFAGDIMGHDEQITGAKDSLSNQYNYEPTFRYVKSFIEHADIAVANLEVTLAGRPYTGYPQFSSPDQLAVAARDAGFDVLIQANNHALDRGPAGIKRSIRVLDSLHIVHTGTFINQESRDQTYPLILDKNNIRIAMLNYTYGTNGIEISKPYIINRIDTVQIRLDLEKARKASPDFVIVTVHWGIEYQRTENQEQDKLALFMLKHGADAIIGSHPHVIQPVRIYYNSDSTHFNIVVYSLGNFVSNQRAEYKDGGIVFELNLYKKDGITWVSNFSYLPTWVYRQDLNGKSTFSILPVGYYYKNESQFQFTDTDKYKISRFLEDTHQLLKNIPENNFYQTGNN